MHPFAHQSIHLIIHSSIYLIIHPSIRSFIHPSILSSIQSTIHPSMCCIVNGFTIHSSIHPINHPFIHPSTYLTEDVRHQNYSSFIFCFWKHFVSCRLLFPPSPSPPLCLIIPVSVLDVGIPQNTRVIHDEDERPDILPLNPQLLLPVPLQFQVVI